MLWSVTMKLKSAACLMSVIVMLTDRGRYIEEEDAHVITNASLAKRI